MGLLAPFYLDHLEAALHYRPELVMPDAILRRCFRELDALTRADDQPREKDGRFGSGGSSGDAYQATGYVVAEETPPTPDGGIVLGMDVSNYESTAEDYADRLKNDIDEQYDVDGRILEEMGEDAASADRDGIEQAVDTFAGEIAALVEANPDNPFGVDVDLADDPNIEGPAVTLYLTIERPANSAYFSAREKVRADTAERLSTTTKMSEGEIAQIVDSIRTMTVGTPMPKILKPSDFAALCKAGTAAANVFIDAAGARIAKMVGLTASAAPSLGDDRSIDFTISTGALDRYNSTIAVDGWHLDAFKRNGVVLWAHDDSIPAIGRAADVRVEGGMLKSRATFADADIHPLADTVYKLIKAKFLSAASVGWVPLKWSYVEDTVRGWGVDYLEQELLEWSVVNIPANPDCLVGARSFGIDTRPLLQWAERALDQGGMLMIPKAELEALRKGAGAPTQVSLAAGAPAAKPIRKVTAPPNGPAQQSQPAAGTKPTKPVANTACATAQSAKPATQSFEANAAALKTLFVNGILNADEFATRLIALARGQKRAGRVISDANEKTLRSAHDCVQTAMEHCTKACEHVMSVVAQSAAYDDPECDPDDPDYDPDNPDCEEESAARAAAAASAAKPEDDKARADRARRERRIRMLKLSASPLAIDAASHAAAAAA